jgi:PKD repeat protein
MSFITSGMASTNSSSDPIPLDTEQVSFSNVTYAAGLQGVGGQFLAWGDYNNDGYQDLLVNGNRLFKNNGPPDWDFTQVTTQVGIAGGSHGTWADWNNDGYLDFFVAGSDILYKNNGPPDWDFTDVSAQSGIPHESHSTGAGWGDYDNDGDVDLYKLRGEDWNDGDPIYYPDRFYRNNGNGTFTDVTEEAGVSEEADPKYGRGCAWADYNEDGLLDIYITNYRQQFNYLYENQGDGTFVNVASQKGVADGPPHEEGNPDPSGKAGHGVGSIWGDYDNDGHLDLWVTNLNHKDLVRTSDDSLLYHNDGPPDYTFTNMRGSSGIPIKIPGAAGAADGDELFVGCAWGDYDNDGDLDLYLPQIYDISYAYSYLYMNNGDGTFTDVTEEAGVRVWDTYAGCWADYDNDGDLDLITSGRDSGGNGAPHFVHLFRNEGNSNNWLHLDIRGDGDNTNTAGIGARVKITTYSGDSQIRVVEGGMGPHGMQNSLPLEFGLGDYEGNVTVEIKWSSGCVQTVEDVQINRMVKITEPPPDLEVKWVNIYDDNPITGESTTLQAVIENVGNISAKSAKVGFFLGLPYNNILLDVPSIITDINPGTGYVVDIVWNTTGYTGTQTIYAVVNETVPTEEIMYNNENHDDMFIRTHNVPPSAGFTISPQKPEVGEIVTFDASSSDDDSMISLYNFDFGDGGSSGWTTAGIVTHSYYETGIYTVTLTVKDDDDAESTNPAEQDLRVEGPPTAKLSASPTTVNVGYPVTFDGSKSYDDVRVAAYFFDFGDDTDSGWITSSQTTHVYVEEGTYQASLKVKDDEGRESKNSAFAQVFVEFVENEHPIAYITSITPSPASFGTEVTFSGYGEDTDGEIAAYEWSSSLDDFLSAEQTFSISTLSIGTHSIFFSVQDDDGEWSSEAIETLLIRETNEKPVIEITAPEDYEEVSGRVIIAGSADDSDGDVERVEVKIDGGTWNTADGTSEWSYELDTLNLTDGEHIITARAFDGESYSEEISISIVVTQDKSDSDEGISPLLIMAVGVLVIVVVVITAIAMGISYKKNKANLQPPPEFRPSEETPGTRMNW